MPELQPGDHAPDFQTTDETGQSVSLSSLRGRVVILYFYPKDDTPGCTKQACAFRDAYAEVTAQNALVFGVSPDTASKHIKFKEKFQLPFPLLLDEDHVIASSYGAWGEKSMYGKTYEGILRSQIIIGPQGAILDAKYKIKPDESVPRALQLLSSL